MVAEASDEKKSLHNEGKNGHVVDEKKEGNESKASKFDFGKWLKYVSLVVLVVQNAGQVLSMRYATTRDGPAFLKTVAVFWNEVIKLVASLILFAISTGNLNETLKSLKHHFISKPLDTIKVGVPAFIYTIQNFLLYVAVENLDAGTYMVTYQMKILTTAMFTLIMLKRKLSIWQWVSLCILIAGVAIVQFNAKRSSNEIAALALNNTIDSFDDNATDFLATTSNYPQVTTTVLAATTDAAQKGLKGNPVIGFLAVVTACFLSGFAGIYFEKILKGSNVSLWLRNFQLAVLSIPIGLVVIMIKDHKSVMKDGFMQGFDWVVWGVVLLQALGGLIVAVVIKYADNILKGFATSIAIVVSSVASIFLFAVYPKELFILGAALVIIAVVIYGTFPYKAKYVQAPMIEMEETKAPEDLGETEEDKINEEDKDKIQNP
uniref:UDP-galactose transporter n=1 Tax=Acrobeloides nanus TaxID=290746 RepID=A0A914D2A5_9BILA